MEILIIALIVGAVALMVVMARKSGGSETSDGKSGATSKTHCHTSGERGCGCGVGKDEAPPKR